MRERIPWIFSCHFFVLSYWLNICQPTSHHSWGNILEAQVRSKRGSYLWIHQMGNWVHGRGRRPGCDVLEQSHTLTARGWMGRRLADGGQPLGAENPLKSGLASGEKLLRNQEQDLEVGEKGIPLSLEHVSLYWPLNSGLCKSLWSYIFVRK